MTVELWSVSLLKARIFSKTPHAHKINHTLQYYTAWIMNQAYLKLSNCSGGNIHPDFDLENIS